MNKLKELLARFLYALPGKRYIVLESNPPMEDNVGAVYRRLIRDGWNETYRIAWALSDDDRLEPREKNVTTVRTDTTWNTIRFAVVCCRAAAILDCNRPVAKLCPKTLHFYLAHGGPIKRVDAYYRCDPTADYVLSQSRSFEEILARELHVEPKKLVTLGYPRNDLLFSGRAALREYFGGDFRAFVAWYPTFRQHKAAQDSAGYHGGENVCIPVIDTPEGAAAVNEAAKKHGVLVVVKPHPAQDVSRIRALEMSNIRFIDNSFFTEHGVASYEFVGACDGLITDYSTVLYDYLLLDRPIGLTWQDVEQYKKTPGFVLDMDFIRKGAAMLDTPEEFDRFFESVVSGQDPNEAGRKAVKEWANSFPDDRSTDRFMEFLREAMEARGL